MTFSAARVSCVAVDLKFPWVDFVTIMKQQFDDKDYSAFLVYAARERSLDASLRAASKFARSDEHRKSIDALRELNKKMLFRETRKQNWG